MDEKESSLMSFEHKENSGALFRNDRREKDTQPHARGEALIGGVLYEVSAWTKEGKKGKFQSLAFKVKEERAREIRREAASNSYGREPETSSYGTPLDDEIPFAPQFR